MSEPFVYVHAVGLAVMLLPIAACVRNDGAQYSQESMIELEKSVQFIRNQLKEPVVLVQWEVSASISNAFAKARKRKDVGARDCVVPICCEIQEGRVLKGVEINEGSGFCLRFWGFGLEPSWEELDLIWLIVVFSSSSNGCCEVVEGSLANIMHGGGSAWSSGRGSGEFSCRCRDPRLGWGKENLPWWKLVSEGACRLYFLMDMRKACGRRFGRRIYPVPVWERVLKRLDSYGVLIELVPVAYSEKDKKCILECR